MTTERDPRTRTVLSWLREDAHENAERVLLRALDVVDTTPQRRSWWPARRFADMNNITRLAVAAAAVLVVAVLGYNLLPRNTSVGPSQPTPTARPFPSGGALEAGRYFWTVSGVQVAVDVPPGWLAEPDRIAKSPEFAWGPVTETITGVYDDACNDGTLNNIGPNAADLATALEEQLATAAVVTTVDLGGVIATRIDLADEPGLDRATCSEGADGPIKIWRHPGEAGYFALAPGTTGTVVTLDARGTRLIFIMVRTPATPAADVAEFDAMIESMVIAP